MQQQYLDHFTSCAKNDLILHFTDDKHKKHPLPSNLRNKKWQTAYVLNKLVKHTLESFWENNLTNQEYDLRNYPVRTHLEKTIGQTVKFFKLLNNKQGHPAILGIEPFNEPHPVGLQNDRLETEFLPEFYLNVESEIRKFDDNIFLFMEPRVSWTYGSGGDDKSRFGPSPFSIRRTFNLGLIRNSLSKSTPIYPRILARLIILDVMVFYPFIIMILALSPAHS
jgi:hypothetical protein